MVRVFYNVPTSSQLVAFFGLPKEQAVEVFEAWKQARCWIHPNEDPAWAERKANRAAKPAEPLMKA
jgi:hypothetical protein